jgi:hypothetical protein
MAEQIQIHESGGSIRVPVRMCRDGAGPARVVTPSH